MFVCPGCGERAPSAGHCVMDGVTLVDTKGDTLLGAMVGSFRITRLIGSGGMGRVYRAVQPAIGGRVAIKVLSEELSREEKSIERFFAEARAVNLIRHEKIVNVLDLSTLPDGRPYIVMEFLDGSPLSKLLRARGPLPIGGFVRFMLEVIDAVAAAHQRGVVHRDLKPDNLFVSPAGHATVLDFGIAKLTELGPAGITQTGQLLGTPKYMSPEQALGRPADARSDVYAIGLILYEGIVGAHPFAWANTYDLLKKQVEVVPQPPSERRQGIPPALEALILQALQKDPERRFKDANAMKRALMEHAHELPPDSLDVVGAPSSQRAPLDHPELAPRREAPTQAHTSPPQPEEARSSPSVVVEEPPTVAARPPPVAAAPEPRVVPPTATYPRARWPWVVMIVLLLAGIGTFAALIVVPRFFDGPSKKSRLKTEQEKAAPSNDPAPSSDPVDEPLPDVPPKTELLNFDVVGFIDKAAILARAKLGPDAQLWMLYAATASADGKVTITDSNTALYYFVSPKRMKHPDGCGAIIMLSINGLTSQRYAEQACDRNAAPAPKCSVARALEKAKAKGFKPTSPIVSSSYMNIAIGVRWMFSATDGTSSQMVEDDC